MAKILIVDDEKDIRDLLADIVEDEEHTATKVGHAQEALDKVDQNSFDLVILDIWLKESHMDGIDILKYIKNSHPDLPVVIISGHGNIEIAVSAIRQGAFDFIEKPFNLDHLLVVVNRALELSQLRKIKRHMNGTHQDAGDMIGSSSVMKALRANLDKLAASQTRVLFMGPAGSGKELAAQYLHSKSPRSDSPFITVNSALLNADDVEKQLFGYEDNGKVFQGLLERANGGTLFFDEISDMPLDTQSKILRVINEQSFQRVGSPTAQSVDVRFLSASKEDLQSKIDKGELREELYHRLAIVPIEIPPLISRVDDIAELATYFVEVLSRRENLPAKFFTEDAIQALQAFQWHGNIRELKNMVERLLILNDGSEELTAEYITALDTPSDNDTVGQKFLALPLREAREVFERGYISAQINRFSGNISKTANFIGMERSALHRKMKLLNIIGQNEKNT